MNGLENINKLLNSLNSDSIIARQMLSVRVAEVLKRACLKRHLNIDFQHCVHVECSTAGIIINTTTPTLANRLKQIQPTLEKALFDSGLNFPIQGILAGKILPLADLEPYPLDPPRVAQPGASEAVRACAKRAEDEDIRKSLERLADALEQSG